MRNNTIFLGNKTVHPICSKVLPSVLLCTCSPCKVRSKGPQNILKRNKIKNILVLDSCKDLQQEIARKTVWIPLSWERIFPKTRQQLKTQPPNLEKAIAKRNVPTATAPAVPVAAAVLENVPMAPQLAGAHELKSGKGS